VSDKRDRNNRRPRRGGFDEPEFAPAYLPEQPAVLTTSSPILDATVTRFDAGRGFGFVAFLDGSPDAFLHVSALSTVGRESVSTGECLRVKVAEGRKGREVVQVVSVEMAKALDARVHGTVTWYNAGKGFGFVKPDVGDKDVFVGTRALRSLGISELVPGQRVEIEIKTGAKGLEAVTLKFI